MMTKNTFTQLHERIDNISVSFTKMNNTYMRIDSHIDDIKTTLDNIDELLLRKNNEKQENRPSCIPGFYKVSKTILPPLVPTPPPNQSTNSAAYQFDHCLHMS